MLRESTILVVVGFDCPTVSIWLYAGRSNRAQETGKTSGKFGDAKSLGWSDKARWERRGTRSTWWEEGV